MEIPIAVKSFLPLAVGDNAQELSGSNQTEVKLH